SHSRSSAVLCLVLVPISAFVLGSMRFKSLMAISVAMLGCVVITADPGLSFLADRSGPLVDYLLRDQSIQQIRDASGRREMWTAIWHEYHHAPLRGHGYFVTSPSGTMLVWNVHTNHTAHNILLQVLVSTGLIGFTLWLAGLGSVALRLMRLAHRGELSKRLLVVLSVMAAWYIGWTIGCVSFMGPVRSESIVFFALMGAGIGLSNRNGSAPMVMEKPL
ncbi:MAG: O-antigen ligase family protein, partial [Planctomycetota bacterium]